MLLNPYSFFCIFLPFFLVIHWKSSPRESHSFFFFFFPLSLIEHVLLLLLLFDTGLGFSTYCSRRHQSYYSCRRTMCNFPHWRKAWRSCRMRIGQPHRWSSPRNSRHCHTHLRTHRHSRRRCQSGCSGWRFGPGLSYHPAGTEGNSVRMLQLRERKRGRERQMDRKRTEKEREGEWDGSEGIVLSERGREKWGKSEWKNEDK